MIYGLIKICKVFFAAYGIVDIPVRGHIRRFRLIHLFPPEITVKVRVGPPHVRIVLSSQHLLYLGVI